MENKGSPGDAGELQYTNDSQRSSQLPYSNKTAAE